jgi:hypothetical protein
MHVGRCNAYDLKDEWVKVVTERPHVVENVLCWAVLASVPDKIGTIDQSF